MALNRYEEAMKAYDDVGLSKKEFLEMLEL